MQSAPPRDRALLPARKVSVAAKPPNRQISDA
jgi:hypothetical protein